MTGRSPNNLYNPEQLERHQQTMTQCNRRPREEGLNWPVATDEENYVSNCAQMVTGCLIDGD